VVGTHKPPELSQPHPRAPGVGRAAQDGVSCARDDGAEAAAFLDLVASPDRPQITARVAIVLAHPDDETIGCGALLRRLLDAGLVLVTDGAPRGGDDARNAGFTDWGAYAGARRSELVEALRLAGLGPDRLTSLDIPDQAASFDLAGLARRLVPIVTSAEIVLTHSYEGGHPDHDATAFAVHAAATLAGPSAARIVEMPFYRAGPDGWVLGQFAPAQGSRKRRWR
jgi:LmbE family N-acetylglucosaminyl deacetylase